MALVPANGSGNSTATHRNAIINVEFLVQEKLSLPVSARLNTSSSQELELALEVAAAAAAAVAAALNHSHASVKSPSLWQAHSKSNNHDHHTAETTIVTTATTIITRTGKRDSCGTAEASPERHAFLPCSL